MTIAELTPPAAEPLTVAAVKVHLRIDLDDEDDLIAALIVAAREHLEAQTGLALITRTFRLYLDQWPASGIVEIARGPVDAIDAVTVYDAYGMPTTPDLTGARLDGRSRPARLFVGAWAAPGVALNGIEIDFTAGFGETAADIPETLKRALMLHVAHLHAFRGAVTIDQQPASVPVGYDRLTGPYRRVGL